MISDHVKVQEFGSEIEDILSGEISIERLYGDQIQKQVSVSPRQKVSFLCSFSSSTYFCRFSYWKKQKF